MTQQRPSCLAGRPARGRHDNILRDIDKRMNEINLLKIEETPLLYSGSFKWILWHTAINVSRT